MRGIRTGHPKALQGAGPLRASPKPGPVLVLPGPSASPEPQTQKISDHNKISLPADEFDDKEKGCVATVGFKRDEEMPQEPAQERQGEEGLGREIGRASCRERV